MPKVMNPGFTTALACSNTWYGIYYESDNPTITIKSIFPNAGSAIGASNWYVLDGQGSTVASGTCNPTDTSITVATSGVWASGGTAAVGAYHFYVDVTTSGVSGGGVTTWNKAVYNAWNGSSVKDGEIWWGVVTTAGQKTINVVYGDDQLYLTRVDGFSSSNGVSTTWSQVATGTINNASSTTVDFPSITATSNGQLYVGSMYTDSDTNQTGSTAGFTYNKTSGVNTGAIWAYNLDVASGATQPTASQTTSAVSYGVGVILAPSAGSITETSSGTAFNGGGNIQYTLTLNTGPSVGDVLVFQHVCTSGNGAQNTIPVAEPQGCLFYICPATNMMKPVGTGGQGYVLTTPAVPNMCAWMGVAQDRSVYEDSLSASAIATTYASDPCFNGAWVDSARPRTPWLSSTYAGSGLPSWSTTVSNMVTAGLTGWTYEGPSNEPEDAGENQSSIISNYQTFRSDVLGADSTAHTLAYCSGGVPENSSYTEFGNIVNTVTFDGASKHDENSITNLGDVYALRQNWAEIATKLQSSTNPDAICWSTETGMYGCYYGTYHPRRFAAQVSKFLLVREGVGYRKEFAYFYNTQAGGGADPAGFVEMPAGADGHGGSIRMGGYAAHILSEALYGTTCSPTALPTQLSFGSAGSIGDVFFYGLQYHSSSLNRDVVVLATNGIGYSAGETVTLNVPSGLGSYGCWNGLGQDQVAASHVSVAGTEITVPLDDLLTYVFLPLNSTVSVVDTGSKVISVLNSATNVLSGATLKNEANSTVSSLAWGNSWSAQYGTPGASPYYDDTLPATLTASSLANVTVGGYALKSVVPWNGSDKSGAAPVAFNLSANGTTVVNINNTTAVSQAIPASPCLDTGYRTTYWDHAFAWLGTFSNQSNVTSVELEISQTSYWGEPDNASGGFQKWSGSYPNQVAEIANIAVLQGSVVSAPSSSWMPVSLSVKMGGS